MSGREKSNKGHYEIHLFVCTNTRTGGVSCGTSGAALLHKYAKNKVRLLSAEARSRIRVNSAGCLNRCQHKPVVVIYPEGTWYSCTSQHDMDQIIDSHVINGITVENLLIAEP